MMAARTKDMTRGNPTRLILSFCLPIIAGNLFQQLYSLVDTLVIGQVEGVTALAAVSAAGWLDWMVLGLAMGMAQGFSIQIAQSFGAGRLCRGCAGPPGRASFLSVGHRRAADGCCPRLLLWPTLTAAAVRRKTPSPLTCRLPAGHLRAAWSFVMAFNLLSGFLRSLGDSRTPLYRHDHRPPCATSRWTSSSWRSSAGA